MIGRQLAHYRIVASLGSGGMGEVYLAEDTKLGREVALKTLPRDFAEDEDRLARFTREARTLAALSHPNIATLHGLEEVDGVPFLVMECVRGETLEDLLREGPISLKKSLPMLLQTAEALEGAHAKGIVHRDLKPANVKKTPEGQVKVLDFGLAKVFEAEGPDRAASQLETKPRPQTKAGVILGTAPYMSPEQARGTAVDKRTDIWAFGCLCYETLTGRRAFDGATVTDAITAVIHEEPDWERLPRETPAALRKLLRRCLVKEPRGRLHDIADARTEIEDLIAGRSEAETSDDRRGRIDPPARRRRAALTAGALGLAFVLGTALASLRVPSSSPTIVRVGVPLDPTVRLGGLTNSVYHNPLAISPDGETLAFVAQDSVQQLYVRRLDELEARPLPRTEGAQYPFFSPDGAWVGFFTNDEIRKVSLGGGSSQKICDVATEVFRRAIWGPDDTILFSAGSSGLLRVSANGGTPERLTTPDPEAGLPLHSPIQFLERRGVLVQIGRELAVLDPEAGTWEPIEGPPGWDSPDISRPSTQYLEASGHLVYAQRTAGGASQLLAVPFDPKRREIGGPAVPVLEGIHVPQLHPFLAISRSGTLAFVPSGNGRSELVRVDRSGKASPLAREWEFADPFSDAHPRFSPDGSRVAVDLRTDEGKDIWLVDERGTKTRLTFGGDHSLPTWTPDGSRIAMAVSANHDLMWVPTDGSGKLEMLWSDPTWAWPTSWSRSSNLVALFELHPSTTKNDIAVLSPGDDAPTPFLATDYNEIGAKFSPDGRFLAYASDESGRYEVYLRPFPGPGSKTLVSTDGGAEPVWSGDGRELFYRHGRQVLSVAVEEGARGEITTGAPRILFEGAFDLAPYGEQHYDVSPDGSQFVMVQLQPLPQVNVTVGFVEELKRLVPVD